MNILSRKEAADAAKKGKISLNGQTVKDLSQHIDPEKDEICFEGVPISYRRYIYIMLNKPEGYVSATEDAALPTVLDLLPCDLPKNRIFPCGRLDRNTHGLMILTDNGPLAHRVLSPKHHVDKKYYLKTKFPISDEDIASLTSGVDIGGYTTMPCSFERLSENEGVITLREGKYHQIKLMLAALHNQVVFLKRTHMAGIPLDSSLNEGEWRFLNENEIKILESI